MFGATVWVLAALATTTLAIGNSTTSNPSRYVQAPIIRDGTPNDPMSGYYWINLGFGHFTVPVIVDTGHSFSRKRPLMFRQWRFVGFGQIRGLSLDRFSDI